MLNEQVDLLIFLLNLPIKIERNDRSILSDYNEICNVIDPESLYAIEESLMTCIHVLRSNNSLDLAAELIAKIELIRDKEFFYLVIELQKVFIIRERNNGLALENMENDGARELIIKELAKNITFVDKIKEFSYYQALTKLALTLKDQDLINETILKLESKKTI